ncbi:MAG: dihydrofolate reductase, partial [Flavobacteriales bacterium]
MRQLSLGLLATLSMALFSCGEQAPKTTEVKQEAAPQQRIEVDGKLYQSEQFADLRVLHYYIPQWDSLSLKQKELVYYLYEAGLVGRDIMFDQNCKYNLPVRHALEKIYTEYKGDKNTENWKQLELYLKQIWAHTGVHHHYNSTKLMPGFSADYFKEVCQATQTVVSEEVNRMLFDED